MYVRHKVNRCLPAVDGVKDAGELRQHQDKEEAVDSGSSSSPEDDDENVANRKLLDDVGRGRDEGHVTTLVTVSPHHRRIVEPLCRTDSDKRSDQQQLQHDREDDLPHLERADAGDCRCGGGRTTAEVACNTVCSGKCIQLHLSGSYSKPTIS